MNGPRAAIERTEVDDFDAIRLRDPASSLSATFVPGAGMVGVSLRSGGSELLGRRQGLLAYVREHKTMGIPLLHPWANRLAGDRFTVAGKTVNLPRESTLVHRDAHGLPMHGLLLGSPDWRVAPRQRDDAADLSAELDFAAHPSLLTLFPFPHRLRLDIALRGGRLSVRATLAATGDVPVPVAFGFHPYLSLEGLRRERWQIELPSMRRLDVDERGIPTGESTAAPASARALGDTALDDAFTDVTPGASFVLAGAGRRITVHFDEGYSAAQVYAPPADSLICFEPMTAPTNSLISGDRLTLLPPGRRYAATFSITVAET